MKFGGQYSFVRGIKIASLFSVWIIHSLVIGNSL